MLTALQMITTSRVIWFALLVCACSTSSETAATIADRRAAVDDGGDPDGDGNNGNVADAASTKDSDGGTLSNGPLPSAFGSYVVLGDSISDVGAGPQTGPFYRDLLYQNDDTLYPAWKGITLKDKFGVTQYVPKAVGGSRTSELALELGTVPAGLATPILVTVTSGGNDMTASLGDILLNPTASAADAQRTADNVDAFLQAVEGKYPGQVYVLQADVYDPSGDTGNFASCPNLIPIDKKVDQATFAQWNGLIHAAIAKHPYAYTAPLHDTFLGHDVHSADNWFYIDCIHPTPKGHHHIRRMFWKLLTGQDGPS